MFDNKKQIVLVSDDLNLTQKIQTLSDTYHYSLIIYSSSVQVLNNFSLNDSALPDLIGTILIDDKLNDMNKNVLVQELSQICSATPIIVMSNSMDLGYKESLYKSGAFDVILNMGVSIQELNFAITRSLRFYRAKKESLNSSYPQNENESKDSFDTILDGHPSLKELEGRYITKISQEVKRKDDAAKILGVSVRTLYRKLEVANRGSNDLNH
jgi:DNA-binding NtrC family response regulator